MADYLTIPNADGFVFCDAGHTQQAVSRQLLYGISCPNCPGSVGLPYVGLRLLDGATGDVIWSLGEPAGFRIHDAESIDNSSHSQGTNGSPAYPWKGGPQLLDVDGDGYDDIVYADGQFGSRGACREVHGNRRHP